MNERSARVAPDEFIQNSIIPIRHVKNKLVFEDENSYNSSEKYEEDPLFSSKQFVTSDEFNSSSDMVRDFSTKVAQSFSYLGNNYSQTIIHQNYPIAVNNNSSLIASVNYDNNTIVIWETKYYNIFTTLNISHNRITCIDIYERSLLVCGLQDGMIIIWDLSNNIIIKLLKAHNSEVATIKFNENGTIIMSTGLEDKTAKLWDAMNFI
eukprot:gene12392-16621_t